MPQTVQLSSRAEEVIEGTTMQPGRPYVLVSCPSSYTWYGREGIVVFRAGTSVSSPNDEKNTGTLNHIWVRDLRPGEKITIEAR